MNNFKNYTKDLIILGTIFTSFQPLTKVQAILVSNGIIKRIFSIKQMVQVENFKLNQGDLDLILEKQCYYEWENENLKIIKLNKFQMAMPGFIDSHVHPQSGGIQLSRLTIDQYSNWNEAKEAIYKSIQKGDHDNQKWIFVYGYSSGWFKDINQSIYQLDEICPHKPLLIMRDDCHAYWCNSKVLEITQTKHNKGIFIEEQMNIVRKYIPKLSEDEKLECLSIGLNYLVQNGIVAFQDASVKDKLLYNYKRLYSNPKNYNSLPFCGLSIYWQDLYLKNGNVKETFLSVEDQITQIQNLDLDKISCSSVKIFVDGVVESKTALMNVKYFQSGHNGQLMLENIPQVVEGLNDRGIQAHFHSMGDAATDLVINSYEKIEHKLNKKILNCLAHLEFISQNGIEKFKNLTLGANFSPLWFYENPKECLIPSFLPSKYLDEMYPIKDLESCVIGFGSDWPVSSPNPFYAIEAAVTRQPLGHNESPIPIGDLRQRVSVEQAMHYQTEGSAQLIQKPGYGRLIEGQPANFIITSQNVFEVQPYEIHNIQVLQTYINWQRVYKV